MANVTFFPIRSVHDVLVIVFDDLIKFTIIVDGEHPSFGRGFGVK